MKKARITPSTFFLSFFITLWREQFVGNRGDTRRNARKSHRGKKTETGGSDPTFWQSIRPKSLSGSLPPAPSNSGPFSPRAGVGANSL